MLELKVTSKFKKDYKRMKKQGRDVSLLKKVIDDLLAGKDLEERHRDHALTGNYTGFRECHVQPDWLLIYAVSEKELVLTASRTGTHSDLFDE